MPFERIAVAVEVIEAGIQQLLVQTDGKGTTVAQKFHGSGMVIW